jgi:hypothetical protein
VLTGKQPKGGRSRAQSYNVGGDEVLHGFRGTKVALEGAAMAMAAENRVEGN